MGVSASRRREVREDDSTGDATGEDSGWGRSEERDLEVVVLLLIEIAPSVVSVIVFNMLMREREESKHISLTDPILC